MTEFRTYFTEFRTCYTELGTCTATLLEEGSPVQRSGPRKPNGLEWVVPGWTDVLGTDIPMGWALAIPPYYPPGIPTHYPGYTPSHRTRTGDAWHARWDLDLNA